MRKLLILTAFILIGLSQPLFAQESYTSNRDIQAAEQSSDYQEWKSQGTIVDGLEEAGRLVDYRINDRLEMKFRPGKTTRVAMQWSF